MQRGRKPTELLDDVKRGVIPVWHHRLHIRESTDASGTSGRQWLDHLLKVVPVP